MHFIPDRHGPQKGSINLRIVWQKSHYYQSVLEKENMLQQYRLFLLNLDLLYASFYFKPMVPKTSKDWGGEQDQTISSTNGEDYFEM